MTDKQLVENVLRGDRQAFAVIIKNTERLVAQIVFKMIENPEDRKDLAQDVYTKAFQKLSGFKFQAKLSTWIGQITYNTCLNYLEKKKLVLADNLYTDNEPETDAEERLFSKSGAQQDDHSSEKPLWLKERNAILQSAIELLPPVYKTLITLYHQEDMSYEEISQVLDLPVGTVKSYLSRARKALKSTLLLKYKREEL
ncbi:MAG: sigma-70 family RNA polymerase sigma factor [Chitinophagaceae bacterium]